MASLLSGFFPSEIFQSDSVKDESYDSDFALMRNSNKNIHHKQHFALEAPKGSFYIEVIREKEFGSLGIELEWSPSLHYRKFGPKRITRVDAEASCHILPGQ